MLDWLKPSLADRLREAICRSGETTEAHARSGDPKLAVLFMCHTLDAGTLDEFQRIRQAVQGIADSRLLYHQNAQQPPGTCVGADMFTFTEESLATLPYPPIDNAVIPGSAHFPLLDFFKQHPGFEHYWLIEYDVRFSGNWRFFFESFRQREADFLACHVRRFADEPRWYWWRCLTHPHKHIAFAKRLRSYNPIYRISNAALMYLDNAQREGWSGHFEVLIATLLFHAGFRIADFGGVGEFVARGDENRFYLEGSPNVSGDLRNATMRWRPAFAEIGPEKDKLFHPVKAL